MLTKHLLKGENMQHTSNQNIEIAIGVMRLDWIFIAPTMSVIILHYILYAYSFDF